MRNVAAGFLTDLTSAPQTGIVPRKFVWLVCKNRTTGAPYTIGFWNGDEDINITVARGSDGANEARTYLAGGTLMGLGQLVLSSDLTVQQTDIVLSQISPAALAAVFEYDVRFAKVEIHEMTLNVDTRQPSATPPCVFYGEVDGSPVNIPSVGGEGSITLRCVSDTITMLTRTNEAKSSFEQQKRRSADQWGKYSNVVANWDIAWGEKD